ncbi:hypothetical protein AAFN47_12740 [Hoeflea sp. CAU 1731]
MCLASFRDFGNLIYWLRESGFVSENRVSIAHQHSGFVSGIFVFQVIGTLAAKEIMLLQHSTNRRAMQYKCSIFVLIALKFR